MDTTQDLFDRIPVGPKTPLAIPSDFDRIHDIAYNMWWSWSQPGKLLFNRMDPLTWERNRNPLSLLQAIEQSTWESLARSDDFLQLYDETVILSWAGEDGRALTNAELIDVDAANRKPLTCDLFQDGFHGLARRAPGGRKLHHFDVRRRRQRCDDE